LRSKKPCHPDRSLRASDSLVTPTPTSSRRSGRTSNSGLGICRSLLPANPRIGIPNSAAQTVIRSSSSTTLAAVCAAGVFVPIASWQLSALREMPRPLLEVLPLRLARLAGRLRFRLRLADSGQDDSVFSKHAPTPFHARSFRCGSGALRLLCLFAALISVFRVRDFDPNQPRKKERGPLKGALFLMR